MKALCQKQLKYQTVFLTILQEGTFTSNIQVTEQEITLLIPHPLRKFGWKKKDHKEIKHNLHATFKVSNQSPLQSLGMIFIYFGEVSSMNDIDSIKREKSTFTKWYFSFMIKHCK